MDNSPLNDLPAELRNQIYEYALHQPSSVAISPNFNTEPGLLRTCKQVRAEAELLFYSINRFTAVCPWREDGTKHLLHWLKHRQGKRLAKVQKLTIRVEAPGVNLSVLDLNSPSNATFDVYIVHLTQQLRKFDFGSRSPPQTIRFIVNGSEDSEAFQFPQTRQQMNVWQNHIMSWMMAILVGFGPTPPRRTENASTWIAERLVALAPLRRPGMSDG